MSIGVLLRGFIGDMMDFGDVILRTLFPSFMTIQACTGTAVPCTSHMESSGFETVRVPIFYSSFMMMRHPFTVMATQLQRDDGPE